MFILEFITNQSTFCNIPLYDCYSYIFLSFSERMLILSITENGEESLIFLVMTIFGECIQLKFSPNYIRDSHLGSNHGFPLKFYFRGHKIPLTLILEDIWGDFGGQLSNI